MHKTPFIQLHIKTEISTLIHTNAQKSGHFFNFKRKYYENCKITFSINLVPVSYTSLLSLASTTLSATSQLHCHSHNISFTKQLKICFNLREGTVH